MGVDTLIRSCTRLPAAVLMLAGHDGGCDDPYGPRGKMPNLTYHLFICENLRDTPGKESCAAQGSLELRAAFKDELKKQGLSKVSRANRAGCLDTCKYGPAVVVYPEGVWYTVPTPDDAREIVREHLAKGNIVKRLLMPPR